MAALLIWNRLHPRGCPEVVAFSLSRDPTACVSFGYSFDCPLLLKHFIHFICAGAAEDNVPFCVPQVSTVGQFAWWGMIGLSPPRYFLIRFSRATASGKQPSRRSLFRPLRVFMESAETITNQVRFALIAVNFPKESPLGSGLMHVSLYFIYFTALFSEAWRDELKELAAKVSLSSQEQKNKQEVCVRL